MIQSSQSPTSNPQPHPYWLHLLAIVTAACCFVLLFIGGLVTSHQAGLSVPDWPTSYGWNMFTFPMKDWMGGIFYEHTHRLFASFVGMLILVQAILWRERAQRGWFVRKLWVLPAALVPFVVFKFAVGDSAGVNAALGFISLTFFLGAYFVLRSHKSSLVLKLSWIALACVVLQGVLGGVTVLMYLPPAVSSAHAGLGQAVFCITLGIVMVTNRRWNMLPAKRPEPVRFGVRTWSLITVIAVFTQLMVGAWMRHTFSGLAIPTFPFAPDGSLIPELNSFGATINFLHTRVGAFIVTILMFATARSVFRYHMRNRRLFIAMMTALFLLGVQITLGAITIWTQKAVTPTTLHVSCGAAILGAMTYIMVLSRRLYSSRAREQASELVPANSSITNHGLSTEHFGIRA